MNTSFIMSLLRKYTNNSMEISQDDFLDLVEGLEEVEINEILSFITAGGFKVIDENENRTLLYYGDTLKGLNNEELCVMAQNGNKLAVDALVMNNNRLIYKIALKILKQYKPTSLDEDDLFIEGSMGLMKAIEKFDVSLGNKFSTYACFWIRQAITRAVMDQGFGVRLPVHIFEKVILVNRCRNYHSNASLIELKNILKNDFGKEFEINHIQELITYADKYLNSSGQDNVSIESDKDDNKLDCFLADESVEEQVINNIISDEISNLLNKLSDKEQTVLRMRFGLEGCRKMTLEEIGGLYNVTRERIRQIEARAIKKLLKPAYKNGLQELYA